MEDVPGLKISETRVDPENKNKVEGMKRDGLKSDECVYSPKTDTAQGSGDQD